MFKDIVNKQQGFFYDGNTRKLAWRLDQLKTLKAALKKEEKAILEALRADMGKPAAEAYPSEIGFVLQECNCALRNLKHWAKPTKVKTPAFYQGAKTFIQPEPLGVALIISPWNYPFLLSLVPLVGTISAGNCVVVKPSEYTPNSLPVLKRIIAEHFDPAFLALVEAEAKHTQPLLEEAFDIIFFCGGAASGRIVMAQAARRLCPVILELGGKNPCIVHNDADIPLAAKKIAWAKFINAGQTCTAPDYILLHNAIKEKFIQELKEHIRYFYGNVPQYSPDYCKIINNKQFQRLKPLLKMGKVVIGGESSEEDRYIAPTVIDNIFSLESPIMEEEIFGPILPLIGYEDIRRAVSIIKSKPKPLAVYAFSSDKKIQSYVLDKTSSGSACINDVMLQSSTQALPFGGVGESGMGRYHGQASFAAFSNHKSVMTVKPSFDRKFRYPPYKASALKLMKLFLR